MKGSAPKSNATKKLAAAAPAKGTSGMMVSGKPVGTAQPQPSASALGK